MTALSTLLSAIAAVLVIVGFIFVAWAVCEVFFAARSGVIRFGRWLEERREARALSDWADL